MVAQFDFSNIVKLHFLPFVVALHSYISLLPQSDCEDDDWDKYKIDDTYLKSFI